jgi:hypothetical protein
VKQDSVYAVSGGAVYSAIQAIPSSPPVPSIPKTYLGSNILNATANWASTSGCGALIFNDIIWLTICAKSNTNMNLDTDLQIGTLNPTYIPLPFQLLTFTVMLNPEISTNPEWVAPHGLTGYISSSNGDVFLRHQMGITLPPDVDLIGSAVYINYSV